MTNLRERVVEAGARAIYEADVARMVAAAAPKLMLLPAWDELAEDEREHHRSRTATQVDAVLDCLSENPDEWADAADELDEIGWPPKGMTLERAERMRSNTHLWFLAVLGNPV